jgi:phosphatidylglycerol:prolipoprotein diacylglycerol transferase
MYPTIIDFGPIGIHSYGLMLATAFITVVFVIQAELKRRGFVSELASAIVMAAAIGGIVGAKLYSALLDGQITFRELFSTSGLVWYGGFIGGCVAVIIVVLRSPNPFLPTIDIVGPTVILGYGIGRIGCLLAGDGDYGPPSDLPWAMAFPNGTVPTNVPVHPTPIYETLLSCTFFGILWSQRRRCEETPGVLFGASLVALGVERFIAEFWRITPRVLGWMSAAQLLSIAAFVIGIALILWMRARPRLSETEVGGNLANEATEGEGQKSPQRNRRSRRRQRR